MFRKQLFDFGEKRGIFVQIAISAVGSAAVLLVMLTLCSLLATALDLPETIINPLATTSIAVSTFVSGMIFSGMFGKNGLLFGGIIGIITFLLLFVTAMIFGLQAFTGTGLIKLITLVIAGAFGGYSGILLKEKKGARR